ncbi:bifunctional riboflavin kinase/FAD synthetase [Rhodobacteraceae bacterium 63075]|nr:bifunctional riboflavin kinase/FAD synthetase [Rhodobacteraceae bacterium 63075]
MQIVRAHHDTPPAARGAAVAIGNFDGVHLGHRAVIDIARSAAETNGTPLGILTFEPHPRSYFAPDAPPFRLMNAEARAHRLEKLGVDVLYELPFDAAMAGLAPEGFAREVISEGLGLTHVVVGADFCFGKDRAGDAAALIRYGEMMGFGVTIADLIGGETGRVSSTAIRAALAEGRPQDAAAMLGHLHRFEGPVITGAQRGRDLGFPTANLDISGLHLPRFGVYAVMIDVLTGPHAGAYHGAASLGTRPMFGENAPNLETYIFDFSGDIYGETISVGLAHFLRPEETFDGLEPFIAQMQADCDAARALLAAP